MIGRQERGHSFAGDGIDVVVYHGGGCQSRLLESMDDAGVHLDELLWLDGFGIGSGVVII